jgi:addiction module HigA family antidote
MFKNGMRPIHPGEVLLEDYILPMGISVRALSLALHVPYSRLREIVDGNRGVSADTARLHMTCEWHINTVQKSLQKKSHLWQ